MAILRMVLTPLFLGSVFFAHIWTVLRQDIRRENGRELWRKHEQLRAEGMGWWAALGVAFRHVRDGEPEKKKE